MTIAVTPGAMCRVLVGASMLCAPALAADVGGWFADQHRARAQGAPSPDQDACPVIVSLAAADPTAAGAYQAALCYLQGESPDLVAAKAWLAQASALKHVPANRMLRMLQMAEASAHGPLRHCHDLGEGRQVCHGGARADPVAATGTK